MKTLNYTATGNEGGFLPYSNMVFTELKGKSVVSIYKDGVGLSKIKSTGIPENKEATFSPVLGLVLMPILTTGEEILMLYQDQ